MIMSAAPAAKVPNALKMLVRYWPTLRNVHQNTPDNEVSTSADDQHPDVILCRDGEATREAEQHQEQPRVRDLHEGANDGNGDGLPNQ